MPCIIFISHAASVQLIIQELVLEYFCMTVVLDIDNKNRQSTTVEGFVQTCYIRVSTSSVQLRLQRTGVRIRKCILAFLASESTDMIFSRSIKHGVNTLNMQDPLHPSPSKGKISLGLFDQDKFQAHSCSTSSITSCDRWIHGMLRSHWTLPNIDTELLKDLLTFCSC